MKQTASVFAAWQQVSKDLFVKSGQIGLQPSVRCCRCPHSAQQCVWLISCHLFAHDFIKLNKKTKEKSFISMGVQDFGNVFAHQPMRHFISVAPSQNALYLLLP